VNIQGAAVNIQGVGVIIQGAGVIIQGAGVILCDVGVFLSSYRRSQAMLECQFWVSRVSASMQRALTKWSRCFDT